MSPASTPCNAHTRDIDIHQRFVLIPPGSNVALYVSIFVFQIKTPPFVRYFHNLRNQIRLLVLPQGFNPHSQLKQFCILIIIRSPALLLLSRFCSYFLLLQLFFDPIPFRPYQSIRLGQTNPLFILLSPLIGLMVQCGTAVATITLGEVPRFFRDEFGVVWVDHGAGFDVDFGRGVAGGAGLGELALRASFGCGCHCGGV
mmetsp:Transcript_24879/g.53672  ORF Transcript_24879/g.53672 Transcript_24879/m.53672 type:complete len:200 (-) Transcript_24879:141-740(-)